MVDVCRDFFESNRGDKEVCKKLQVLPEAKQVSWELEPASAHSPGVVANDEQLCRQVLDPTHFDSVSGTIKPTFFDDASDKGASCHRLGFASPDSVRAMTVARAEAMNVNPPATGPRTAIGYTTFGAEEVRSIRTAPLTPAQEGRRGAAVYDTALPEDVSHADVCQLVAGRQEGKSVRAQLWKLAKDRLVRFVEDREATPATLADKTAKSCEASPTGAG